MQEIECISPIENLPLFIQASCFFCKNCPFRSSYPISSTIVVAYETRLTENGIPLEPNPRSGCGLSLKEGYTITGDHSK